MKVLHLSTHDFGGAGKAAYRLHKNLTSQGIDSRMLVLNKRTSDPSVYVTNRPNWLRRLLRFWQKAQLKLWTNSEYYFQNQFASCLNNASSIQCLEKFKPDHIIAHWITYFITAQDLGRLEKHTGASLIWYLLDMAPLTGGCHCAWTCPGFKKTCGSCPALFSDDPEDFSNRCWRFKKQALLQTPLTIVAGSGRLAEQAKLSSLYCERRIEQILIGLDGAVFKPEDRRMIRDSLELPQDKQIIFFNGLSPELKRKGMHKLVDALKILAEWLGSQLDGILLLSTGDLAKFNPIFGTLYNYRSLGILSDLEMAAAYQAADLFVCPSIEDAGPMMINESLMCGTPIVAFEMGVACNLVLPGVTGYRAQLADHVDLATGILSILALSSQKALEMSEQCATIGVKMCSAQVQARDFLSLLQSISANCYKNDGMIK